ncbi:hypothetical protein LNI90_01875 [Tenacibaculum dicentrarchi]|uniref:Uncharacterized protein n=1 Tax=Tenacibaculum dicentrarchi TaxID=669041 RepID=A0ABP1EMU9_9FLAO|nr:hypothetical protein [Tenacibaculum dicentrarchi]MCD8406675.1 hypothetical protein [Tenacibaculum dicentrarchi]MCD8414344.1 hypothetical protein [Tenacibaculum dicentrarchi]MCD8419018.1 hypothetical protein [Tenacibaculum dicentrarchi]MCD8424025.1 hypothetical protein [Tenacibaculum dicentrarchi]
MNYNQLILTNRNFDTEFVTFIDSYQNLYNNIILKNCPNKIDKKIENAKKRNIKDTLEDFFFTPRYNVLNLLKLNKS